MFYEQLQAFLALPIEARNSAIAKHIEQALAQHQVRAIPAEPLPGETWAVSMQDRLREADFVIADITGNNPNVMMEVGMALGMDKQVLLLSQGRSEDLPADLASRQVAIYRPSELATVEKYLGLWLEEVTSEKAAAG